MSDLSKWPPQPPPHRPHPSRSLAPPPPPWQLLLFFGWCFSYFSKSPCIFSFLFTRVTNRDGCGLGFSAPDAHGSTAAWRERAPLKTLCRHAGWHQVEHLKTLWPPCWVAQGGAPRLVARKAFGSASFGEPMRLRRCCRATRRSDPGAGRTGRTCTG
jgi:hypothetical protein